MAESNPIRPWTPRRIAKVRRAVSAAFDAADAWARAPGGEESDDKQAGVEAERHEALALIREFTRIVNEQGSPKP